VTKIRIPAPGRPPVSWLPPVVIALGPPVKDPELDRWTWYDGDVGVFVDKLTYAWQTVAWTPARSVTLRAQIAPSDADMTAVIALAGLTGAGVAP
jgi:hypothetical protein